MWIIPKNTSACSPSSPASEGSTSASTSPAETWASRLATSATWRGKHSPSPVWSRRWNEAIWLRRLCSSVTLHPLDIPPPMSSSQASLAPPSPALESASASKTNDGSGPKSSAPFATLELGSWVSKTSEGSFLPTMEPPSVPFSETWPNSGSMQNGRCFERPTSGPLTSEPEFSSSPSAGMWPTPYGFCGQEKDGSYGGGGEFAKFVTRLWPTPDASVMNDATTPEAWTGPSLGPPVPPTSTLGTTSSTSTRPSLPLPRLNPTFVTWLMGFPRNWTDPTTWTRAIVGRSCDLPPASTENSAETVSKSAAITTTDGTSEVYAPPTSASDRGSRTLWPTPGVGDSESGQSKHSFNAQRGGGDSRLRVTAIEFVSKRARTDLFGQTPSAPSETPSSPHKPDSPSPDCGAGSASA